MSSKFQILIGDRLPDFTNPLAIVAATTVNISHTALERYILIPGTNKRPKEIISEKLGYKIDLSTTPPEVLNLDSIFDEGLDRCEGDIELKFYSEGNFDKRALFLKEGRYRFHKIDNHKLFTYKWRFGFAQEIRQMHSVTFNPELKEYLRLVESVALVQPESKNLITEL